MTGIVGAMGPAPPEAPALFPLRPVWTLALTSPLAGPPAFNGSRGYFPLEGDHLAAYDLDTGEELWVQGYPAKIMDLYHGGGTLTTPTVEGEFVYVSEREGKLRCLKAKNGDVVWEKEASKEFGLDIPQWGFSASPVVLGDNVILNYGKVFAFDKKKGTPVWQTKKGYGDAYSTPIDFAVGERRALAVFAGTGLVILAGGDGAELSSRPGRRATR